MSMRRRGTFTVLLDGYLDLGSAWIGRATVRLDGGLDPELIWIRRATVRLDGAGIWVRLGFARATETGGIG